MKKFSPFGLQVEVVGIALPLSVSIAQVFKNLKVKHILCFDTLHEERVLIEKPPELQEDAIERFKFNYIYEFCVRFYSGLVHEKTVIQAFTDAEMLLAEEMNLHPEAWRCQG